MTDDKLQAIDAALKAYTDHVAQQEHQNGVKTGIRAVYNALVRESVSRFKGSARYDTAEAKEHFDAFEPAIKHMEQTWGWLSNDE